MSALKWIVATFLVLPVLSDPAPAQMPGMAQKHGVVKAKIAADMAAEMATITWDQYGHSNNPFCDTRLSDPVATFVAGEGSEGMLGNSLCSQDLECGWAVRAFLVNGKTKFINPEAPTLQPARLFAAAYTNTPGIAASATTFEVETSVSTRITAKVERKAEKDKAVVISNPDGTSEASETTSIYRNSSLVIEVSTALAAGRGGMAFLDRSGLTLLANPGQVAEFQAVINDMIDPRKNSSLVVSFDGHTLYTDGIDPGLFMQIPGGYFLPYADLPAEAVEEQITGRVELEVYIAVRADG